MIDLCEEKQQDFINLNMMELQEIAAVLCANALERVRETAVYTTQEMDWVEWLQEPHCLQRFKIELAQGMASLLAAHDDRVLAAYLFDETANTFVPTATAPLAAAATHLLFLVSRRSAALYVLADALDKALVRELNKLSTSILNQDESLVNPLFITKADVAEGKGYAVLLSSALAPPRTIWQRD